VPKVTVLGGGRVGSAIALDLVGSGFAVEVADASEEALARFSTVPGLATRRVDLTEEAAVAKAVRDCDIVVGAVPGFLGYGVLRSVLGAGKPAVDISFFGEDALALEPLARKAGVAAIVGAFLAGIALSESVTRRVHDLAYGVSELLVPFFLAGIGLHLDVSIFARPGTLALGLAMLLAAVVSEVAGCGLGSLSLGRSEAIRVGVGMVPRGEVGMVVAQIGLGLGVIGDEIYGVAVFMAVMTTIAAPPLLKWAYRDATAGAPTVGQSASM